MLFPSLKAEHCSFGWVLLLNGLICIWLLKILCFLTRIDVNCIDFLHWLISPLQCLEWILLYTLLVEGSPPFISIESPLFIVALENNILFPKLISPLYPPMWGRVTPLHKGHNLSQLPPFEWVTTLHNFCPPLEESLPYLLPIPSFFHWLFLDSHASLFLFSSLTNEVLFSLLYLMFEGVTTFHFMPFDHSLT